MNNENKYICNICGSSGKILGYKKGVKVLQCPECSFLWKDIYSLPSDYYETWQYGTSKSFDLRNQESVFKHRMDRINKFISGPSRKILDFGCGKGEFVEFLKKQNYDAFGCDIGDSIPDKPYFFKTDIGKLQGHDFDIIFSSETFEHIEDVSTVMRHLSDRTKKGGIIYLETQFTHSDSLFGWGYFDKANHISFFSPRSMEKLMKTKSIDLIDFDNRVQLKNAVWTGRRIIHFSHIIVPDFIQRNFLYKKFCSILLETLRKVFGKKLKSAECTDWVKDILLKMNCTFIGKRS